MTKKELFKKYSIDISHSKWEDMTDNWMSVEIFRVMHEGRLPEQNDTSVKYITDFLDKCNGDMKWMSQLMKRKDWGSLYLTAKRQVYRYADDFLTELTINP